MSTYNHTGQVVTDLERSKRFYQEVLGFRLWYEISPPDDATAKLCGLTPPLEATISYLVLDGFVLELMHYSAPAATAAFRPRRMNEPGLTHLSISVHDVRAVAEKAATYGGQIIEESDIGSAIFIRDPDGQLLELLPAAIRPSCRPSRRIEEIQIRGRDSHRGRRRQPSNVPQRTRHQAGFPHPGQRSKRGNPRPGIHTEGTSREARSTSGTGVRASQREHSTTTVPLRRGGPENNARRPCSPVAGGAGRAAPNRSARLRRSFTTPPTLRPSVGTPRRWPRRGRSRARSSLAGEPRPPEPTSAPAARAPEAVAMAHVVEHLTAEAGPTVEHGGDDAARLRASGSCTRARRRSSRSAEQHRAD